MDKEIKGYKDDSNEEKNTETNEKNDLIDKEEYKKDYEKYTSELNKLKNYNTNEPILKDYSHLRKILDSDYKTIYNNLSIENKKKFWLSIIDKIYIENGEIKEVTFL